MFVCEALGMKTGVYPTILKFPELGRPEIHMYVCNGVGIGAPRRQ